MRWAQLGLGLLVTLLLAARADAQAATATPSATPSTTPTSSPIVTPPAREQAKLYPLSTVVLNNASTAVSSGAFYVGDWTEKSVQVTIGPSCTSYTLHFEVLNGGTLFAAVPTPAGMPAQITEATVAAGATLIWPLTINARFFQARLSAIADCTVSVYLQGAP